MLDMFKDVWAAMTSEQREGIAWLAVKGDRIVGEGSEKDMMRLAIAACHSMAKANSANYEEYQEEIVAVAKGMVTGLLDGGMYAYLRDGWQA